MCTDTIGMNRFTAVDALKTLQTWSDSIIFFISLYACNYVRSIVHSVETLYTLCHCAVCSWLYCCLVGELHFPWLLWFR